MTARKSQIACPTCRSTITLSFNGNTLNVPLVCPACGQTFSPRFYCPDAKSPVRHTFAATALHIDNAEAVYTFCPEHTFTTYALTPDNKPRPRRTPMQSLARFFDTLLFRLALAVEGLRWRLVSRR